MNSRVQCGLTAGVAIVGAGVIAVTPIATPAIQPPKVVEAAVSLAADFTGLDQQQLIQQSAQRFAEQLAQLPFIPLLAALDIAADEPERLYAVVKNIVDSPLYVADPLIEAVANTLPEALGGGSDHYTGSVPSGVTPTGVDGDLIKFRNTELLGLRDEISSSLGRLIGVDPTSSTANDAANKNYAWDLVDKGLSKSAENLVKSLAAAPVGLVPIAVAIVTGQKDDLYRAIREYIDAPLYIADPTIEQLARALPDSLGGGTDGHFDTTDPDEDGGLMQFRTKTLIANRDAAHHAVADALGVQLDSSDNPLPAPSEQQRQAGPASLAASVDNTKQLDVKKFKPHPTSLGTALKKAQDRAEQRAEKAKERRAEAAKNVRQAVKSLGKKLGLKKPGVKKVDKKREAKD